MGPPEEFCEKLTLCTLATKMTFMYKKSKFFFAGVANYLAKTSADSWNLATKKHTQETTKY